MANIRFLMLPDVVPLQFS